MPERNKIEGRKKERDSKYELLRIIAMAAITLNHAPVSADALAINMYLRKFFFLGGKFGSYLFVIIGAWFLAGSEKWSAKGIVKIILQTVFYGVLLDLVCMVIYGGIGIKQFLSGFNYWFCFSYVFIGNQVGSIHHIFRPLYTAFFCNMSHRSGIISGNNLYIYILFLEIFHGTSGRFSHRIGKKH